MCLPTLASSLHCSSTMTCFSPSTTASLASTLSSSAFSMEYLTKQFLTHVQWSNFTPLYLFSSSCIFSWSSNISSSYLFRRFLTWDSSWRFLCLESFSEAQ